MPRDGGFHPFGGKLSKRLGDNVRPNIPPALSASHVRWGYFTPTILYRRRVPAGITAARARPSR